MSSDSLLQSPKSALIIGMAGGLAKITAKLLTKKFPHMKILGVDSREIKGDALNSNISYKKIRYTRGQFEKLFRDYDFDLVLHLGRMGHTQNSSSQLAARLDLNLIGTQRILELSLKFKIKKIIILSTYHVYGALSDNPAFITEESHLRASIKYPELRDVVEMDQIASNWVWRYKEQMETIVLRPCSIIGPQINNSITKYLKSAYAPLPIDFNPMFQFIHEFDMANLLVESCYQVPRGIYNIAPYNVISLQAAKEILDVPSIPVPIFILERLIKLVASPLWRFPRYLIDYLKYPCLIDNEQFMQHLPNKGKNAFRFSTNEALNLLNMN